MATGHPINIYVRQKLTFFNEQCSVVVQHANCQARGRDFESHSSLLLCVALGHIFFFVSLKLYKQNLWLAATMGPRDTTYSFLLLKTIMVAAKNCGLRPQFGTGHKYCNFGKCVTWVYCCLEPQHEILWPKAMLLATSLKKIRSLGSQWSLKSRTVK